MRLPALGLDLAGLASSSPASVVAGLPERQQYKVLRGNAERLFRFTPDEVDRSVQDA